MFQTIRNVLDKFNSLCTLYSIVSSPPEKIRGGVEDFGSRDIGGGGLALISGFWGDLEKRGE